MSHRVSIVVVSHREQFAPGAIAAAFAQGPEHQVIFHHSRENWPSKINEAIRASNGEFFVFLPEDDLLAPDFVSRTLEHADQADVVLTDRIQFRDGEEPAQGKRNHLFGRQYQGKRYYTLNPPLSYFECGVSWPATFLCRRSFWDQTGGLDEAMPHADTEWFFRAWLLKARFQFIPEPLLFYRKHAHQYSVEHPETRHWLKAYHRKHFVHFGLDFDHAREIKPNHLYVKPVPPDERAAYAAAHATAWAQAA